MKSLRALAWLACFFWAGYLPAHEPVARVRSPIRIPDVPGYVVLKCDFHIHTVFSDGLVWPTVRVEEAWRDGLDAIAITDHLEYQPHKADVNTNHNRAYDIASGAGRELETLVVRGSEITRQMPPGHLNAIFLKDSSALAVPAWRDALAAAHKQEAFIFWNHPGWASQLTDGQTRWFPEHTELLEKGMLHGIEVVNGDSYYPEAHRWAIEKKLTMLSNSDIHQPIGFVYQPHEHTFRPVTLVFTGDRSPEALKQALLSRQTVVYAQNRLIGEEKFLRPIFEGSIRVAAPGSFAKPNQVMVQIHNDSSVDFELQRNGANAGINAPKELRLPAGKTVLMPVTRSGENTKASLVKISYNVMNLLTAPDAKLNSEITVRFPTK